MVTFQVLQKNNSARSLCCYQYYVLEMDKSFGRYLVLLDITTPWQQLLVLSCWLLLLCLCVWQSRSLPGFYCNTFMFQCSKEEGCNKTFLVAFLSLHVTNLLICTSNSYIYAPCSWAWWESSLVCGVYWLHTWKQASRHWPKVEAQPWVPESWSIFGSKSGEDEVNWGKF